MIHHLSGEISQKGDDFAVVDVNGVGYKVYMSSQAISELPQEGGDCTVFCYLNISRNSWRLYGFPSQANLEFFESLINLSGIGPKTAVKVASIAPMDELKEAIKNDDEEIIEQIYDIGEKRGKRVMFELSQRVQEEPSGEDEAVDGLTSLGFSKKDAQAALKTVSDDKSTEDRIEEALKVLDNG